MSLLTIGTVAFDTVETPFGRAEKIIGGACTYISYAASYFTNEINLSAIVGKDFPEDEIASLRKRGVNLEGLEIKEDGLTFFWEGKYHMNMNSRDTITTDLNVLEDFNPVLPESYKSSKYVMLGNLTPDIQKRVLDQLDGSQELIAMDTMNFWMDIAMDTLKDVIARVDVLTINDEEARQLSGEYSLVKAASKIFEMGPKYLVIKKGEHGALLFYKDQIFFAPALPLAEVFDPTGAGDTFAGGMLGYLAKTRDTSFDNMKRAIIYGSAMASFCVEEFGISKLKQLTKEEIDQRVGQFSSLVHYTMH
ncbi:MAG: bifunctional hydroxymethylpyrimidine kinase/phosphomethylpyrimidine kinase [Saprospiraceae bacterium]|nr:bifunctional hydroxymethylpyrimidine kinase/phosphomethylpyrimidine kinase [Saprospiraceae bacterium]